ncbi:hypothetical protein [Deinococcus ficus]|uniref:hypothetical protein n=1 Tax=Deinococcus ficus TaxID=317577 RepID=UPI0003B3D1BD|nr:hypothetical protein [Deinococcus ficus]
MTCSPTRNSSSTPQSTATEHETQEWCLQCEQSVPELLCDICLNCLDGQDPNDSESP